MVSEDHPRFPNWDQNETAIRERYGEQDPEVVAEELEAAALTMVDRIRALTPADVERTGVRSNGDEFTVETLLQYFLHDIIHHLWDVTGQQDAVSSLALDDPELVEGSATSRDRPGSAAPARPTRPTPRRGRAAWPAGRGGAGRCR